MFEEKRTFSEEKASHAHNFARGALNYARVKRTPSSFVYASRRVVSRRARAQREELGQPPVGMPVVAHNWLFVRA